jgi:hypothetical protein
MVPLFQLFEFSYPDGLLFYDRSGRLSRRLQELIPGLGFKSSSRDQLDMVLPTEDIELFFGIGLSHIQTLKPDDQDFPSTAARFLQVVSEVLELTQLNNFRFRYVLGRPCSSDEEAQKLMWPLIPEETKTKLKALAELPKWRAVQAEFLVGNCLCESRTAIIELVPHRKLATFGVDMNKAVPHVTFHVDFRGVAPIVIAEFDAAAFMKNVREKHAQEILEKLAPHLT